MIVVRSDLMILLFYSIRELILIAVKHSGKNKASIKFEEKNGKVGIVISNPEMDFDFEIGKKNEETVKNSGLSRIHEILKQHGCRLEIINKKGEGALVSLLIPRAEITFGEQRVQDDL